LPFVGQQSERDYKALSYAVMDQKDYLNISCEVNVESVEVFFDAVDDRLIAFIDQLRGRLCIDARPAVDDYRHQPLYTAETLLISFR